MLNHQRMLKNIKITPESPLYDMRKTIFSSFVLSRMRYRSMHYYMSIVEKCIVQLLIVIYGHLIALCLMGIWCQQWWEFKDKYISFHLVWYRFDELH